MMRWGVVWYGGEWCGVVWSGVVWPGVVWCSCCIVVWRGVVCVWVSRGGGGVEYLRTQTIKTGSINRTLI